MIRDSHYNSYATICESVYTIEYVIKSNIYKMIIIQLKYVLFLYYYNNAKTQFLKNNNAFNDNL